MGTVWFHWIGYRFRLFKRIFWKNVIQSRYNSFVGFVSAPILPTAAVAGSWESNYVLKEVRKKRSSSWQTWKQSRPMWFRFINQLIPVDLADTVWFYFQIIFPMRRRFPYSNFGFCSPICWQQVVGCCWVGLFKWINRFIVCSTKIWRLKWWEWTWIQKF